MSERPAAIELSGIAKGYGRQTVLRDLALTVRQGEIVCLHGPSGCGKTTIVEIVAGALAPDRGTRVVRAARIGYMFQDDCLIPWETVEGNVRFALTARVGPESARAVAERWLGAVGLGDSLAKKPAELSGGMKRRVNLARSLAVEPDLLLLDEPFAFQDAATAAVIRERVLAANRERGTTVVLVSHDLRDASALGGRMMDVRDGSLRERG
jgi:NitT/TauT family transport system ATP-binding protein